MQLRVCKSPGCGNFVPRYFIDTQGKKHNCQNRRYCFTCSPFGHHNSPTIKDVNKKHQGICPLCNGLSQRGNTLCYRCYFKKRQKIISKKVYDIVGYKCWRCGYEVTTQGTSILEFHHLDPKSKLFGLTTREFVGNKWEVVINEIQKCVSLCCRCHREYHANLISTEEIHNIYINKWEKISENHSDVFKKTFFA